MKKKFFVFVCLFLLIVSSLSVSTFAAETWYTNYADTSDPEWLWDYRISASSDAIVSATGSFVTNYIPCSYGDILRFYNGVQIPQNFSSAYYDSDMNLIAYFNNSIFSYSADTGVDTLTVGIVGTSNYTNVAYVRISGKTSTLSVPTYIITINQDFLGDPPVDPDNPGEDPVNPTGIYYSAFKILSDNIYGYGASLTADQNLTLTILATAASLFIVALPFVLVFLLIRCFAR